MFGIEGPAVDSAGNLYAVNLQKAGTIGKLKPRTAASEFFAALPEGSIGTQSASRKTVACSSPMTRSTIFS
jgi:hypothetical protein